MSALGESGHGPNGSRRLLMTQTGSGVCIAAVEDTRVISYSITSSAMASNFRGPSRARALAVLRLMTSSNFVGRQNREPF